MEFLSISISSENPGTLRLAGTISAKMSDADFNLIREPWHLATCLSQLSSVRGFKFQSHPRTLAPCDDVCAIGRRSGTYFNLIREPWHLATNIMAMPNPNELIFQSHPRTLAPCDPFLRSQSGTNDTFQSHPRTLAPCDWQQHLVSIWRLLYFNLIREPWHLATEACLARLEKGLRGTAREAPHTLTHFCIPFRLSGESIEHL